MGLEAIARFPNPFVRTLAWVYWDALGLFGAVTESLRQVAERCGRSHLAGLGVDAMGEAFALLDSNGELLGNPRYSRLPQEAGVLAEAFRRVAPERMIALGDLSGVTEGRELIRRSFPTETFVPRNTAVWDEHFRRYADPGSCVNSIRWPSGS